MSWGSLFQTEAAGTTKARSLIEERRVAGLASRDDAAERRCNVLNELFMINARHFRPHILQRLKYQNGRPNDGHQPVLQRSDGELA